MRIAKTCSVLGAIGLLAGCSSLPAALDPFGYGQARITSGIDDAQTDVAFLDNYSPEQASPAGLVPRGPNRTLLALPGMWEGRYWSYCLHAGVQRPSEGDGYAYAPLKGPDAQVIRHILQNQLNHPEIEEPKIQVLIWAILARTKLSEATPEIRETARVLLSPDEIDRLNGGALGKLPPELLNKIVAMLPPELRQAAKVNADLRELLNNPVNASYEQIERIAAPLGNFPAPAGSREIAVGRWSYDDSQRLFVRYFPSGYSSTRIQFYAPEQFTVERDQSGRIGAIADRSGTRLEFTYKPEDSSTSMAGDPAVHVRVFASIRLTAPDRERPWEASTFSLDGSGWALTGVPNGNGRSAGVESAALQQRYDGAFDLTRQIRRLGTSIHQRDATHALDEASLVELGEYAAALQAVHDAQPQGAPWLARGIDLFYRAWMSRAASGVHVATASLTAPPHSANLPTYDPSPSVPGNTGRQRLAQSSNDNGGENGADRTERAKHFIDAIAEGSSAIELALEGTLAPYELQLQMLLGLLGWDLDAGRRASDGLAGRPSKKTPHVNVAPLPSVPLAVTAQLPSAANVQPLQELVDAWTRFNAQMAKAAASQQQYRSALAAGNEATAGLRARELTNNLRATGLEMLQASSKLSVLSRRLQSEGWDRPVTLAAIRKYKEALKANGFSKAELEAAKTLGMSDEAIKAAYAARLQPVTDWQDTTLLRLYDQTAEALQELGRLYAALPVAG